MANKYCRHPVVIIGGGFCGLTALKTCKENGLNAVCFEKTDDFGGLWRFREGDVDGIASVTRSTIINTSKEMSAFSDFPPSENDANFMHNTKIMVYLEDYAKKFDLFGDVRFEHEVIRVSKADDYKDTGEWTVHVRRRSKDQAVGFEDRVLRASAVLVCIGHHVFPNVPNFPGQSEFCGIKIHTHSYKDTVGFENKKVLVVGIGNSGMDAATEVSLAGSQVYLSTRRGGWIVQRMGPNGFPIDFGTTRFSALIYKLFPTYHVNMQENMANSRFDHTVYNLKPKHRIDGQHPTFGDMLPSRIIGGAVVVKSDVHRFTEHGVIFKGEENREYDLDAVIFATGYKIQFPFLDDGIMENTDNRVQLYRRVIPTKIAAEHPTLGFIGLVQPIGAIFPAAEMQCRWLAKILKGDMKLPPAKEIQEEVQKFEEDTRGRYVESQRHTFEVDFVPYMDLLAEDIGCKPNLIKLFFTDFELFRHVLFGPAVPYQYRLAGSDVWPGAREAIVKVQDRMRAAFQTRMSSDQAGSSMASLGHQWLTRSLVVVLPCMFVIGAYYAVMNNSPFL